MSPTSHETPEGAALQYQATAVGLMSCNHIQNCPTQMADWLTDWLIDWWIDVMTGAMINWLIKVLIACLTHE